MFKNIDKKFEEIGYKKIEENDYIVVYERPKYDNPIFIYTQTLELHKKGLIFSYDKNLFDTKNIGNTCVGLTCKEMKLILKKMKKKGWY